MSPRKSTPPRDANEELVTLIETLHQTVQRLGQLTADDVNTLGDRDGQMALLRRAQEHLQRSQATRQASILNALPAKIALLDTRGCIISVNDTWRQFANPHVLQGPGYGIGVNYLEICESARGDDASEAHQVAEGIRSVLSSQAKRFSIEYSLHSPTKQRWFLLMVTPLNDDRPNGAVVIHLNITKRKHMEERLQKLSRAVEQSPAATVITDIDGGFEYVNPKFLEVTGYSQAELIGKTPAVIRSGLTPLHVYQDLWRTIKSGGVWQGEIQNRKKNGKLYWEYETISSIKNEHGEIVNFIAVEEDITERKRIEKALSDSEAELRAAQRVTKMGNWYLNLATGAVSWSDEIYRVFGCDPELPPPTFAELGQFLTVASTKRMNAAIEKSKQTGRPYEVDLEILRTDGATKWIVAHGEVVRDEDDQIVGLRGTAQDISERKAQELKIVYLSRINAMLSGINTMIVRVRDRDELFREACRIAVQEGGFRMTLVAVVDPSTKILVPAASAGEDEALLNAVKNILSTNERASKTMSARAIREKKAVVSNDSQSDPQVLVNPQYIEAGVRSMAVFPLIVSDEAVGVFVLYASEVEFFREEEIKLLTNLAGNIAFAIDHIGNRKWLEYLAYHDVLTGLPNRSLLCDRLNQAIGSGERFHDSIWVALLNIDRFTVVNNSLGQQATDRLLKLIAARLQNEAREADTLARFGDDEFMLVLPKRNDEKLEAAVVHRLMDAIAQPFTVGEHTLFLTCCVGVAIYPRDGEDTETLINHAGIAMHRAKTTGSNNFQFYEEAMNAHVIERLRMLGDLRDAVEREEFVLHYQPQVDFRTGRIVGMEALVRWNHPRLGLVPPDRFIGLAEETGMIVPIGAWVIGTACRQNKAWQDAGVGNFRVAVNLSARQFGQQDLVQSIAAVLQETGLEPGYLEIELTESMMMTDVEQAIEILGKLKLLGVQLSIDDFGTGYSSLAYLKRFPIDALKIDRSFVRDIAVDAGDAAIAKAIVSMAHSIGIRVIAEGVETEQQCAFLCQQMCDELQGYFISKPLAPTEIENLLRQGVCLPPHLLHWQEPLRTLLIVDDEVNIVAALKRLLRRDNYQILTANSGQEGLDILAEHKHAIDVIISDQLMPGMTGVDFLRKAKTLCPDTVRIVLSGYTELQSVIDAVNEGAIYKFLTKPWDDAQLREHVEEAFRHRILADENRRLNLEVQNANQDLAASNRKLSEVLKLKQKQIGRDEVSLDVMREALQHVPLPVIGLDDDEMIVFANDAALTLFNSAGTLLGADARQLLPELSRAANTDGEDGGDARFTVELNGLVFQGISSSMGQGSQSRGKLVTLSRCEVNS